MARGRQTFAGGYVDATLAAPLAAGTGTGGTFAYTGVLPPCTTGPQLIEIGPGGAADEKVLISAASAGTATILTRGADGTVAVDHQPGEFVGPRYGAMHADEANAHANVTGLDDHTQYLNVARHDTPARHGPTVVIHANAGALGSDDHVQYARADGTRHFSGAVTIDAGGLTVTGPLSANGGLVQPPGLIQMYAVATAPTGWLLCDGSAVSRATWAALFAVIGTTFGAGDGSTTFNLPDLRGKAPIGQGAGAGLTPRTLAVSGGEETHVLTTAELAAHNHGVTDPGHGHGVTDPGHGHGVTDPQHKHGVSGDTGLRIGESNSGSVEGYQNPPTGNKATFTTLDNAVTGVAVNSGASNVSVNSAGSGITTNNNGSGTAHNNVQPFLVLAFIIKT